MKPLGVILAGGQGRRLGGVDKALVTLGGATLLTRVIDRLAPQCAGVMINANGDPARFAAQGLPVIPDAVEGFAGPLAGVLTGMEWARAQGADAIVTVAVDTPFFPENLVLRLQESGPLSCAETRGRTHPVFGLWPVSLAADLRRALVEENLRKVDLWTARHGIRHVSFDADPEDPFFNINRPEDIETAEKRLAGTP